MRTVRPYLGAGAGLVTGLLLLFSQADIGAGMLAALAFVPMLVATRGAPPGVWVIAGTCAGLSWFSPLVPALWGTHRALAVVAPLALACVFGALAWLSGLMRRRFRLGLLALPCAWVLVAYPLDEWLYAAPSVSLGWVEYPRITRLASLVGVTGLDALTLLANTLLAELIAGRDLGARRRALVAFGAFAVSLAAASALTPRLPELARLRIAGLQPVIRTSEYRKLGLSLDTRNTASERLKRLAKGAAGEAALVVWPEGGSGLPDLQLPARMQALATLSGDAPETSFLVSAPVSHRTRRLTAVGVLERGQLGAVSFKRRPVPLAEAGLAAGPLLPLATAHGTVGALICFDALFGRHLRGLSRAGAELFVVTSDDASFGLSSVVHWHARLSELRAREVGRPLVFVSNAGPSFAGDAAGRVAALAMGTRGVLFAEVPRVRGRTVADLGGRHLGVALLFASACAAVLMRGRRPIAAPARDATGPRPRGRCGRAVRKVCEVLASACLAGALGIALEVVVASASFRVGAGAYLEDLLRRTAPVALRDEISPAFVQTGPARCGAAATAFAMTRLGDTFTEPELSAPCLPPTDLISFADIAACGRDRGFSLMGLRAGYSALRELGPRLGIAHLVGNHFVVILRADARYVVLFDPAPGRTLRVSRSDLEAVWTGALLVMQLNPLSNAVPAPGVSRNPTRRRS